MDELCWLYFERWKGFGSVSSSSSQANEVKELRRDSVRASSKGLRGEGVKGLRKNFLTQRTQRSERTKYFLFINKIVTDGVGHLRTYGPRGQVKGGRGQRAQKKGIKVGLDAKWGGFKVWK